MVIPDEIHFKIKTATKDSGVSVHNDQEVNTLNNK